MGLATAAWHWTPAEFMAATAHEYFAAYEVYRDMNKAPDEGDGVK